MKENPCFRIGHLQIVDHLILGITDLQIKSKEIVPALSTLETIAMNSWGQVCEGLTDGHLNGAFITLPLAMDLFASGLDIRVLMFTHRGGSLVVKKKSPDISTIRDFKGRTTLIPSNLSIQNMLLHRLLSSAGLTLGSHNDKKVDVTREVVNPCLMPEMLGNDSDDDIAGFVVAEPFGSLAVHTGMATKICASGNLWKDHPCCAFVLNASIINDYPEAVGEMVSLFTRTAKRIESHRGTETFFLAQDFLKQSKEVTRHALSDTDIRFDPSLLFPDEAVLDTIQSYMADTMGVLKNKIDLKRFIDSSFIPISSNFKTKVQHTSI